MCRQLQSLGPESSRSLTQKLGRAADDSRYQRVQASVGDAQKVYGQRKGTARDTAMSLDQWFRRTIDTQPLTAALVVLGIAAPLGRVSRPL